SRQGDIPPATEPRALPPLPPEAVDALGAELQLLLDRILDMPDLELALLVREAGREALAGLESLLQQGMVGRSILEVLGAEAGSDLALDRFAATLRAAGFAEEDVRAWRDRYREELDRLRATVRAFVRAEFERVDAPARRERRGRELSRASLGSISAREAAEM